MNREETFRPNWARAQLGMIAVTAALLVCSALSYLVDDVPAIKLLLWFCATIWVLVAAIVIGNSASTFQIDTEFLTYRSFGIRVMRIPMSEVKRFHTEVGIWPGVFELTNGSTIHVSGIAVGQGDRLSRFLATHHPHITTGRPPAAEGSHFDGD